MTEADTCRELVTPKLVDAGWGNTPHVIGEQRTFTNGRIACDKDGKRVSQPSALIASELIGDVLGGEPIFCTNTVDDVRTNEYESVFTHNLRAVVVTPLKAAGSVAGMLYIANPTVQASQDKLRMIVSTFVPIFALGLLQCRATAR